MPSGSPHSPEDVERGHALAQIEDPTPAEVDSALIILAACGGNSRKAEQLCAIPKSTLHRWRTTLHRDRYLELAERERPRLEQIAVEDAISTILQAGAIEHDVLALLAEKLEGDEPAPKELSELASTLQRVTTSKGINGTKLLELTGRPTVITEHRDGASILRELKAKVPGLIVDSTATEIPTTSSALRDATGLANAREQGSSSTS